MTEEYMKRKYEELESMKDEQRTDCTVILLLCVLLLLLFLLLFAFA